MAWQLVYTSAPRLLEAGRSGFGTVARHREVPPMVVAAVERFSQFSRQPGLDPDRVVSAHRVVVEGGRSYHVLSCIRDAGADYTGRTNHVAHHLIAEEHEVAGLACSPADVLLGMEWLPRWDQLPLWLEGADTVSLGGFPAVGSAAGVHWEKFCGDGMKVWLLVSGDAARRGWLVLPDRLTSLGLLADALSLHPGRGWGVSFTTSLQPSDERGSLSWLGVEAGSPVRDYSDPLPVLDLTAPHLLPEVTVAEAPEEHPFSEAGASWGRGEESCEEAERAGWQAPMRAYPVEEDAGGGKFAGSAAMPALRAEARMDFSTGVERRGAGRSRQWWALGIAVLALVLAGGGVLWKRITQQAAERQAQTVELEKKLEDLMAELKGVRIQDITKEKLDSLSATLSALLEKMPATPKEDQRVSGAKNKIKLLHKLAAFRLDTWDFRDGKRPEAWGNWEEEWTGELIRTYDFDSSKGLAHAFQKEWVGKWINKLERKVLEGGNVDPEYFNGELGKIKQSANLLANGEFDKMPAVEKLRKLIKEHGPNSSAGVNSGTGGVPSPAPTSGSATPGGGVNSPMTPAPPQPPPGVPTAVAPASPATSAPPVIKFAVGWDDLAAMEIKELAQIKGLKGLKGVKFKWTNNKVPSDGKELTYWPSDALGGERIAKTRLDQKPFFFELKEGDKLTRGEGGPAPTDYGDIEVEDESGHKHVVVHVFPAAGTIPVAPKKVAENVRALRSGTELILEDFNPEDYLADVVWTVRFNGNKATLTRKDGAKWTANIPEAVVDMQQTRPATRANPNPATPDELFMPDGGKAREWKGKFNTDANKLEEKFKKQGMWRDGNNPKTVQEAVGLFAELLGTAAGSGGEGLVAAGSDLKSCPGNDQPKLQACLKKALEAATDVALNGDNGKDNDKKSAFDSAKGTLKNKLKDLIKQSKPAPSRPAAAPLPSVPPPTAQTPPTDYEVVFSKKPKNGAPPPPSVLYFKKKLCTTP